MGVPGLFPYINNNFPGTTERFQQGERTFSVDVLCIDGNGPLHSCAQEVFNYGPKKMMFYTLGDKTLKERELILFEQYFDYIINLTKMVVPREVLFICIDGVAPRAKQAQQRQRRFLSTREAPEKHDPNVFDPTSLSPGTEFMHNLTQYLKYAIRKYISRHKEWRKLKVIFSPPTVPGEGEHTCLEYIRAYENKKARFCIFSPDGDLMMLMLSLHLPNVFLFREDLHRIECYNFMDMRVVRNHLPKTLRCPSVDLATDDFVIIGFFVGNDFLPRIQMFLYLKDGLDFMVQEYRKLGLRLSDGKTILYSSITKFVELVAEKEQEFLVESLDKEIESDLLTNHTLIECVARGKLDFIKYQKKYYTKVFGGKYTRAQVDDLCFEYLKTIHFIYLYYAHTLPSWNHYYRYHYPPLMISLSSYLKRNPNVGSKISFEPGTPSLPYVQLLSILSSKSVHLLPKRLRDIPKDSRVAHTFPLEFEIDYEGKRREHEAIVLLPFADRDLIEKLYNEVILPKSLKNCVGKNIVLEYSPEPVSYKSYYGNIKKCYVKKTYF